MKNIRMATRLTLAGAVLSVACTTAACSGETPAPESAPSSTTSAGAPAEAPTSAGGVSTVASGAPAPSSVPAAASEPPLVYPELPKGAPKDFPVPTGAKVSAVGTDGSFTVVGEGAEKVMSFYRKALPGAGYKITSDEPAALAFEGASGKGKVAIEGDHVAVTLTK